MTHDLNQAAIHIASLIQNPNQIVPKVASQMYHAEMLIDQLIMEYYFGEKNKDFEQNVLSSFKNNQRIIILQKIMKKEHKNVAKTFEKLNKYRNRIIHGGFITTVLKTPSDQGMISSEIVIEDIMVNKSNKETNIKQLYKQFVRANFEFLQAYWKYKGMIKV